MASGLSPLSCCANAASVSGATDEATDIAIRRNSSRAMVTIVRPHQTYGKPLAGGLFQDPKAHPSLRCMCSLRHISGSAQPLLRSFLFLLRSFKTSDREAVGS